MRTVSDKEADQVWTITCGHGVEGSQGRLSMVFWSMLADAPDRAERGSDLTLFGLYAFTNKVFHGVVHA